MGYINPTLLYLYLAVPLVILTTWVVCVDTAT